MPSLSEQIRATARDLLELAQTAASAELAQWERSYRPTAREDTTERGKGGHGDPTADVVLDETRQALREAYREAERVLFVAGRDARKARRGLDAALAAWHAESADDLR